MAVDFAYTYLEVFGVTRDEIRFTELSDEYGDDNLHLIFSSTEINDEEIVWGDIVVSIGENGNLLGVTDNRVRCIFYRDVDTISPRASIAVARAVGVGNWDGKAYVSSVDTSYHFNTDTGFLVPVWSIQGTLIAESGEEYKWTPYIDATK